MCLMDQPKPKAEKHIPCYAEETLDRVEKQISRLTEALLGNEFNENKGLVSKVEQNTRDIAGKVAQTDFDIVKAKVDRINHKIAYAIGGGAVLIWILERTF